MMGYELVVNFRQPYFSRSVGSSGGGGTSRSPPGFATISIFRWAAIVSGFPRHLFNLMVTFVVSGLWHGANWTFSRLGFSARPLPDRGADDRSRSTARLGRAARTQPFPQAGEFGKMLLTFSLVTFAWAYFRANTVGDAWYITSHLLPLGGSIPLF